MYIIGMGPSFSTEGLLGTFSSFQVSHAYWGELMIFEVVEVAVISHIS